MNESRAGSKSQPVDRRSFLATSLAAGLAATAVSRAARAGEPSQNTTATPGRDEDIPAGSLPAREFGRTGRQIPILALGGSAMVTKWQDGYGPQLSIAGRVAMVRHAFDAGIRYFDTSPNYGESESIIGEALSDVREQVYLATKVGVSRSDDGILQSADVRASLEKSLETLRTPYVDCVQVHGPAFEYLGVDHARKIYDELEKLRTEKLFRHVGVTGHSAFEAMYRLIDTGLFDQALIAYGYFPKGMDTMLSHSNLAWRERCLSRAKQLGMGVVAMKVLSSFVLGYQAAQIVPGLTADQLSQVRAAALRWALHDDRITIAVVGATRPADIDQNIQTLAGDLALSDQDRSLLAEFTAKALQSPAVQQMKIV